MRAMTWRLTSRCAPQLLTGSGTFPRLGESWASWQMSCMCSCTLVNGCLLVKSTLN